MDSTSSLEQDEEIDEEKENEVLGTISIDCNSRRKYCECIRL